MISRSRTLIYSVKNYIRGPEQHRLRINLYLCKFQLFHRGWDEPISCNLCTWLIRLSIKSKSNKRNEPGARPGTWRWSTRQLCTERRGTVWTPCAIGTACRWQCIWWDKKKGWEIDERKISIFTPLPILAALIKLLHLPFHSERRNGEYGCVGGSFRREALQDADVDAERVREFVPHGVDVQRDACGGGKVAVTMNYYYSIGIWEKNNVFLFSFLSF